MTLAAHEDKTFRGAYVASPSMPWVWGQGLSNPSDVYHKVWSRDLYQVATALLAAGDRAGANRSVDYLFTRQQKPDGCFPQNSNLDGTEKWKNLQLDEAAFPIVLAWQLGRRDAGTYAHVKEAIGCLLENGPQTPQERWENQGGWSPATIASEIAGLVTAADLARANGDTASATAWEAKADEWQAKVDGWTVTTNGPYSPKPYYLRITKETSEGSGTPDPNAGTTYNIGDSGPENVDQRRVTDPSYPRARAPRRQALGRPGDPQHARRRRPAARRRHAQRPLLAPLRLRRLRREEGRRDLGHRAAEERRRRRRTGRRTRRSGASGRSSPASAASTSSPPASPRRRAAGWRRWPAPQAPAT